ncbi:Linoleate 9S-lipoxygenase 1 [Stylosanthes scabra]|uniref:Linoleate 9S-lipoxygenase 1 n=1 Tax=Stylosanthes scabra TaxID=79078 RepID=A0ABU6SNZ0_9FABA|nr:Linoleate 9S-lipoxygenase 1 [Stylosanthes scabra]
MFQKIMNAVTGGGGDDHRQTVKGTVVLMKKNVLDFNDFSASLLDRLHEFLGNRVSLQLISSVNADHGLTSFKET